jgi:hypothetical protein
VAPFVPSRKESCEVRQRGTLAEPIGEVVCERAEVVTVTVSVRVAVTVLVEVDDVLPQAALEIARTMQRPPARTAWLRVIPRGYARQGT